MATKVSLDLAEEALPIGEGVFLPPTLESHSSPTNANDPLPELQKNEETARLLEEMRQLKRTKKSLEKSDAIAQSIFVKGENPMLTSHKLLNYLVSIVRITEKSDNQCTKNDKKYWEKQAKNQSNNFLEGKNRAQWGSYASLASPLISQAEGITRAAFALQNRFFFNYRPLDRILDKFNLSPKQFMVYVKRNAGGLSASFNSMSQSIMGIAQQETQIQEACYQQIIQSCVSDYQQQTGKSSQTGQILQAALDAQKQMHHSYAKMMGSER